MSDSGRPRRVPTRATVVSAERLSPHMVRVVFRLPDGADFAVGEFSDHYVKLLFPPVGADYAADADMDAIQQSRPREEHPVQRAYTVRRYDPSSATFVVDFVWHGDKGLAGPWAAAARPGDELSFVGPGGAYLPADDADWFLMIADESALPAVAASLERVPPGRPVHAFVEVDGPADELPLWSPGALSLTWVHREGATAADLATTVTRAALPAGDVHVFLHGDATMVRELRRFARTQLGVDPDRLSASGYWRRGLADEAWRASKREWNAQIQADEAAFQH